jgi:hypothetical protein
MSKRSAVWAALKIYKWKLLFLALTVLIALVAKNYIADAKPVGGGAPNPNIDPLYKSLVYKNVFLFSFLL